MGIENEDNDFGDSSVLSSVQIEDAQRRKDEEALARNVAEDNKSDEYEGVANWDQYQLVETRDKIDAMLKYGMEWKGVLWEKPLHFPSKENRYAIEMPVRVYRYAKKHGLTIVERYLPDSPRPRILFCVDAGGRVYDARAPHGSYSIYSGIPICDTFVEKMAKDGFHCSAVETLAGLGDGDVTGIVHPRYFADKDRRRTVDSSAVRRGCVRPASE